MAKSFNQTTHHIQKREFLDRFNRAVKRDDLSTLITLLWKENIRRHKKLPGFLEHKTYDWWCKYFYTNHKTDIGNYMQDKVEAEVQTERETMMDSYVESYEEGWQFIYTTDAQELGLDDIDYENYRQRQYC